MLLTILVLSYLLIGSLILTYIVKKYEWGFLILDIAGTFILFYPLLFVYRAIRNKYRK